MFFTLFLLPAHSLLPDWRDHVTDGLRLALLSLPHHGGLYSFLTVCQSNPSSVKLPLVKNLVTTTQFTHGEVCCHHINSIVSMKHLHSGNSEKACYNLGVIHWGQVSISILLGITKYLRMTLSENWTLKNGSGKNEAVLVLPGNSPFSSDTIAFDSF